MKILKELKAFEEHCLENNDLQAELIYNAQETIKVMIEDRDSLISAAEAMSEFAEDLLADNRGCIEEIYRTPLPKNVYEMWRTKWVTLMKLQSEIKEAKGDDE